MPGCEVRAGQPFVYGSASEAGHKAGVLSVNERRRATQTARNSQVQFAKPSAWLNSVVGRARWFR